MRSRSLVVVLALILATVATVGVFLYARGVREDLERGKPADPAILVFLAVVVGGATAWTRAATAIAASSRSWRTTSRRTAA